MKTFGTEERKNKRKKKKIGGNVDHSKSRIFGSSLTKKTT